MESILNIAVISDIHCKQSAKDNKSEALTYLTSDLLKFPIERNPVEALKKVIREKELYADLLLCPGDITDKVDRGGLVMGWKHLEALSLEFNVKLLAATLGNHDVDSRKKHSKDPFDLVKRVSENFPSTIIDANLGYWANHYCLIEGDVYDLLIINSCFNHTDEESASNSEITQFVLDKIEAELKPIKNNTKVKIALCHHHPMHHSNMDYKDGDFIDKGDSLLKLLEESNFTICIHGHKHDPRLQYFNKNLPVMAAGSFSSMMNLLDLGAQNTFHYIQINTGSKKGTINSWVYLPKSGWIQKDGTYFPCKTGFGFKTDIVQLGDECAKWIDNGDSEFTRYSDLVNQFPDLQYLIPSDQEFINNYLNEKYNIRLMPSLPNMTIGVSKLYV